MARGNLISTSSLCKQKWVEGLLIRLGNEGHICPIQHYGHVRHLSRSLICWQPIFWACIYFDWLSRSNALGIGAGLGGRIRSVMRDLLILRGMAFASAILWSIKAVGWASASVWRQISLRATVCEYISLLTYGRCEKHDGDWQRS